MNTHVVRSGTVSIKEDGFASFLLWRPKLLVLKEHSLMMHKNEVSLVSRRGLLRFTIRFLAAQSLFHPL